MPVSEATKKVLRDEAGKARIPNEHSAVEKDECMLSFDNQFSPNGLYTNLNTWQSFGRDFVEKDSNKTGNKVYLYQKYLRVAVMFSFLFLFFFFEVSYFCCARSENPKTNQ